MIEKKWMSKDEALEFWPEKKEDNMDRYIELEQAKEEYFLGKMLDHKQELLQRFNFIAKDDLIKEKFLQMLVQAECEECDYADFFVLYFKLSNLDKACILDDLDCFTEQYLEDNQQDYIDSQLDNEV